MPPRHSLILEGELRPYDADSMVWYYAYTVVLEEFRSNGYPEAVLTLYPRVVCNSYDGCPGVYAPAASQLEVRNRYVDGCYAGVYEAYDLRGYYDPIREVTLIDSYGSNCGYERDPLSADVLHSNGQREFVTGYRTY